MIRATIRRSILLDAANAIPDPYGSGCVEVTDHAVRRAFAARHFRRHVDTMHRHIDTLGVSVARSGALLDAPRTRSFRRPF